MMSIDVMQKRDRPTLLHRFLPRFIDPKLERRYRDDRLHYRLTALRVSFAAGIAIWILFVALDLLTIHDPSTALFYVRIAGILSLIPFYLATFLIKPGRWIEVIGFGAVLTQILLLTALVAFLSPVSLPYYQPTEVWITIGVATFVVCGVSFIDGLIPALGTVCGFLLSVTIFQPEPLLLIGFDFAWLLSVLAFVGLGSYILDRTQHITWLQEQELLRAEDQIRGLLHNVLPPSIAARKLAGESPVADSFAEASVLFADVVDFTSLSARLESPQIVSMLNELFSRFDRISARHGLEKIKTIGDCYMAVAGIPEVAAGHLTSAAQAAIEMLNEARYTRAPDGTQIAIRIGLHAGPVTAGVIGETKFIFDVWGDTVNTASRMESHGAAGRIQVTDKVRLALCNDYRFAGPSTVDVKGKGPTRVWFLEKAA